ncbi:MAG TPA: GNAT family N-acetyltransferase [Mucilaginibacter sp.]|jgi:RimJ/RimL family protein N-acetyltransferase|nr:GNAT family N-acetyltransferase [Mucilaginibacter sp.]
MNPIVIRTATLNDFDILLDFERGIMEFERPMDSTIKEDDAHYYDLATLIESADAEVVVAEQGGELIGSGYAHIIDSKSYLKHQRHAHLGFMYVKPDHRGKGVNQMIIDVLQRWALSKNINEFRLEVYHNNPSAIRAYEKAGFMPCCWKCVWRCHRKDRNENLFSYTRNLYPYHA